MQVKSVLNNSNAATMVNENTEKEQMVEEQTLQEFLVDFKILVVKKTNAWKI